MSSSIQRSVWFPVRAMLAIAAAIATEAPAQELTAVPIATSMVVPQRRPQGMRAAWRLFHSPCQFQQVQNLQFLFRQHTSPPGSIRAVAFRRFDVPQSPATWPAFSATVELWMGHTPQTPAQFGYSFPSNRGPDFQQVTAPRTLQFPTTSQQPGNEYPFAYRIPLDRPFAFGLPTGPDATGLIEMRVHDSTLCLEDPANQFLQWEVYSEPRPNSYITYFGSACTRGGVSGGDNFLSVGPMSAGNPSSAVMNPQSIAARGSFAKIYGGLRNDMWAGLALPYSLGPLGAPACSLYISFDWEWPYMWPPAATMGGFTFALLDLVNSPSLVGLTIYVQGVRFDRAANPLGITTSDAVQVTIGAHHDPEGSMLIDSNLPQGVGAGQRLLGSMPLLSLETQ